ncbi:HAD superfamily hydrolase (TIGR01490 family) [Bacillus mesophilus]|uniref:Haloacid dehalogenase-like hydrolase n=1 Tax=Bacillus mesophilus TaxID=1808955 RepID=A0A6M0Q868_9BACI|nr:HAD family hydrolase [Bacillus mesophilus]MBM7662173.1 HAD superfamily hydrolase (TIGR01490 family) [Bacillus mesophilus]NEY72477.1 haloacid dehalogenase-like hydrolase [Bacillus mesophilus]
MSIVTVDFDGTLYQGNSFKAMFEIGKKRFSAKEWLVVASGLVRATAVGLTKGKLKFQHEFFKAFAKTFKNQTNLELDLFFKELVELGKDEVHQELVYKIREHQSKGDTIIVLSGALQPFLKAFTTYLDLDVKIISTELLFDQAGHCTGEIGEIVNGDVKVQRLKAWIEEQTNIASHEIWAYADSESDIPLLKYVTHPMVVNPKTDMLKIAEQNSWPIFGVVTA